MRINSPADDPTGLVLSSNLNSEIRTLAQAMQNAQDGINLLHTGIDSLQTMESTLLKLKELTEKAANGTYSASERQEMQKQANELLKSLYTTKNSTSFGQINIFGSKLGSVTAPSTPSVASYVNYAAFMYDTPSSVGSATNDGSGYKNYEINTTAASYTAQNLSSSAPVTDSNAAASETIIIRSAQEFVDKISQDGTGTEGKTYVLDADIDLSSISDYAAKENFAGTFDGNGHTIIFNEDIFSSTTQNAVIQNLYADSTDKASVVVGMNNGTVEKIFLTKNLSETVDVDSLNNQSEIIRGIVETNNGIISESKTEVNGQFYYYSGDPNSYIYITSSLIAEKNNGVIRNTYSSGTMNFNGQVRDILGSISGLVANNTGTITNSFSSVEQNINFTLSSKPSNDGISSKNSGNITSTFAENTTTGTQVSDISDSSLFSSWDTGIWDISGVPSLKAENNMTSKIYITSAQEFIDKIARNGSNTEGQVYVLGNDIDFSTVSNYTAKTNFAGTIIGNGHTIKNLTSNQGLFESTTETASIRDLTLDNFTITASGNNTGSLVGNNRGDIDDVHIINSTINGGSYQNIGGLAGHSYNAAISNSSSSATVSGGNHVGGLVGSNDATITNSYSTGDVTGTEDVGGLVGSTSGDISNSYSTGNVSGTDNIGGLVGNHTTGSTISNSYATGDVTGTSSVGGLTGVTLPYAVISNSYATGTVTGTEYVGALAGLYDGVITNSFFNKETSGVSSALGSGSSYGVTGLTGSQFATSTPFVNAGWSEADWDFTVDGPHLVWENYEPAGSTIHISSAQEFIDKIARNGSNTEGQVYVLGNDIDFSTVSNYTAKTNFAGTIIGNGHTIKNLTSNQGLFESTTETASIRDLTLDNFTITASGNNTGSLVGNNRGDIDDVHIINSTINGGSYQNIGGLAGHSYNAAISNSSSSATVSGGNHVGGLVGSNDATITNSYSTGDVTGTEDVGGLVGSTSGDISNSYSTGNVSGTDNIGGLVGNHTTGSTISNSYATGDVTGTSSVGGLTGVTLPYAVISNSYATGTVTGTEYVGALAGLYDGVITNSFFNKETSGVSSALGSGSSYGVTGLTGSQFATSTPFVNAGWSEADWDFTVDGPHLVWENYEPAGSTIHISSAQEFIDKIAQDGTGTAGRTYILDNDIDFSTISNYVAKENFSGTIIGNGHTIKNLTSDQGLFVTTTNTASISDLTLENFTITASENNTGALVGVNRGDIDDVHVNNSTINGGSYSATGALVGSNYGAISNSSSSATVSGDSIVGGLVGFNYDASITNSYATGNVEGSESVGGLIGANYSAGIITNSYATGNVEGRDKSGGLVGSNEGSTIENSYATGNVNQTNIVTSIIGGLVGYNSGTITGSHAEGNVSGQIGVGGLVGQHSSGSITGSYATGDIFGQTNVGGFSGSNNGIIENSYATGDVEGSDNAGGFAGVNYGTITGSYAEGAVSGYSAIGGFVGVNSTTASGNGEISDSYSTGTVTGISGGSGNIGGFVGNMTYGTFTNVYSYGAVNSSATNTGGFAGTITGGSVVNSFWNTTAAGMTGVSSGASTGLTGLTTQEFMNMNNFVGAGWNDTIWNLTQGNPRPHLEWENYVGPGVTPGDEGDPDFDGYPDFPDSGGQSGSYPTDPGNSEAKTEVVLQIGTDNDESSRWTIDTSLDFDDIWINLSNSDTSNLSLDSIDAALSTVREKIASFSTTADILKSSIETSEAKSENLEAAKSTILDADIAAEMVELMKAKRQFELSNTMLIQAGNIQYDQAMALINGLNFSSSGQEVQNTLNNIQNNGRQHQSILDVIQDNKISHQDILNSIQNNNIYHQSILDVVADNNAKNNIMLKMINKYK